jgi:hypothetical protein
MPDASGGCRGSCRATWRWCFAQQRCWGASGSGPVTVLLSSGCGPIGSQHHRVVTKCLADVIRTWLPCQSSHVIKLLQCTWIQTSRLPQRTNTQPLRSFTTIEKIQNKLGKHMATDVRPAVVLHVSARHVPLLCTGSTQPVDS